MADYSAKHKRHGVNVQVITDPAGEMAVARAAGPDPRSDGRPHPPNPSNLRPPGRPDPHRHGLHRCRRLGHHRQTPSARRRAHAHRAN
jgi:hypothetical protein